jgi:hypothetical protein
MDTFSKAARGLRCRRSSKHQMLDNNSPESGIPLEHCE